MNAEELKEFKYLLYYGQEIWFIYGKVPMVVYFIQGWTENGVDYMYMQLNTDRKDVDDIVPNEWNSTKTVMHECADEFLETKMWDGRSFLEALDDIYWPDDREIDRYCSEVYVPPSKSDT